jgi:hypothetical protein
MTTVFLPVGTSIITNQDKAVPPTYDDADKILESLYGEDNHEVDYEVNAQLINKNFENRSENRKDTNPAEISSLLALATRLRKDGRLDESEGETLRIVLLHSPGVGKACAERVRTLIDTHVRELLTQNTPYGSSKLKLSVDDPIQLDGLNPGDEKQFASAVGQLASILGKQSKDRPDEPVYLNVTGGYKGLVPYLTLFGLIMGKAAKVFYLYEESKEIIELPAYPFAFDMLEWRDRRSLLWPFQLGNLLNGEQKQRLCEALSATRLAGLVHQGPDYALNEVGSFMEDLYARDKGRGISEFGQGELLLDQFESVTYGPYLKEHCIPRWRHLSFGDHIPETVDHGRGHVQRLLELAQQLLVALGQPTKDAKARSFLTDEQLFVLLGSLWLHDIGHTTEYFAYEDPTNNGLVLPPAGKKAGELFPVHGDPARLRATHHVLSYEVLKQERAKGKENFLFPEMEKSISDASLRSRLLRSIELAALYHKREMPLTGEKLIQKMKKEDGKESIDYLICTVARGIQNFKQGDEVIEGFPLVAALLRFLDGAENQEERAGGSDLYEVTKWVLERQKDALEEIKKHPDYSACIQAQIEGQRSYRESSLSETFPENRLVRHVFMTVENGEDGPAGPTGVFGEDTNSSRPVIGVYFIARVEGGYKQEDVWEKRIRNSLDDFKRVQQLFPFTIKVFLIEDNAGSYRRWRLQIENYEAEREKWVHHFV